MAATFVVEDGNGLPNANAYVTLDYANDYFASRGVTAWAGLDDTAKQVAIVQATDYIEKVWGPRFLGAPAFATTGDETIDQALSFPRDTRSGFIGNVNYSDVQFIYSSDSFVANPLEKPVQMPKALLQATCEYAMRAAVAVLLKDPTVDASGVQLAGKTTTVGPITTSVTFYNVGGVAITQPYPAADLLLKSLVRSGGKSIRG